MPSSRDNARPGNDHRLHRTVPESAGRVPGILPYQSFTLARRLVGILRSVVQTLRMGPQCQRLNPRMQLFIARDRRSISSRSSSGNRRRRQCSRAANSLRWWPRSATALPTSARQHVRSARLHLTNSAVYPTFEQYPATGNNDFYTASSGPSHVSLMVDHRSAVTNVVQ